MLLVGFLTVIHVVGVALGAGGAFFAEVFYLRAIRDGIIDPTESDFLKTTYRMLRIGTILLIITGFGLFLYFRLNGRSEFLYNSRYWIKETLLIIILCNALLLQARRMPVLLGSAISLASWTAALVVGAWRSIPGTYVEIMLVYLVLVPVTAWVLEIIRRKMAIRV